MGNTCASVHIAWRGSVDDASKAISRSYGKIGYERLKKAPAEKDKQVFVVASPGVRFVSIYDSDNALLDSGELKELALAASKALKTAAVFTSLYDSDTFEWIVFANGRQIDLLMTDAENYDGPMKRLSDKARPTKWAGLFGRTLSADQIKQATTKSTAFADDAISGLASLIGLGEGRAQINFQDLLEEQEKVAARFSFRKKPQAPSKVQIGEIRLADYFDPDNCRMRSVYPAGWPIAIGSKRLATWLILTQGSGFSGGTATVLRSGQGTLNLPRAILTGCKFHNGQIVGSLEPVDRNLTQEDIAKLVDSKRFDLKPLDSSSSEATTLTGEYPHLFIPSMTPERTTQILLVLQIDLEPQTAGDWTIEVDLQPGMQTAYRHRLPPVRIVAVEQNWLPVVTGLNPKTSYDKSNLSPTHLRELNYRQAEAPKQRQLDHPAVTSSVAILEDQGQLTLDACKSWFEDWLWPLTQRQDGEIRIYAEKHMTESFHVGKTKKNVPAADFIKDKAWGKLFDLGSNYQTVLVSYVPKDAECPIAGIALQNSFKDREQGSIRYSDQQMADALSAMRGRPFGTVPLAATWHVSKWVINHDACYGILATSPVDMEQQLDRFAAGHPLLQAWNNQCTWIPLFDKADSFECTVYEEIGVLNWFRGILGNDHGLHREKMTDQWCRNVLRMVAPRMWLCRNLLDQVNRAELERVAEIREQGDRFKITLRSGCALDELELALLPILPVESARISVIR